MTTIKSTKSSAVAKSSKKKPSWSDVKAAIANFDRLALISLIWLSVVNKGMKIHPLYYVAC